MGDKNNIYSWDIVHTSDEANGLFHIPGPCVISVITGEHGSPSPLTCSSILLKGLLTELLVLPPLPDRSRSPNLKLLLIDKQNRTPADCPPGRGEGAEICKKTHFPQALQSDAAGFLSFFFFFNACPGLGKQPEKRVCDGGGAVVWRWHQRAESTFLRSENDRDRVEASSPMTKRTPPLWPRALMRGDRWTPLELRNLQT